jgi:hypothetical protein
MSILDVLVDAAVYSEYVLLTRCDIGPKTVEHFENEYMNLRLIVNKYNIFVRLQVKKKMVYTR